MSLSDAVHFIYNNILILFINWEMKLNPNCNHPGEAK